MTMSNEDGNEMNVIPNRGGDLDSITDIYLDQYDKKPRMKLMKDSRNNPESENNVSSTHTKKDEK